MKKFSKLAKDQRSLAIVIFIVAVVTSFTLIYSVTSGKSDNKVSRSSCSDTCVALHEDRAVPDTIAVEVGDYVQFNSADGKSHNLSLGMGGEEHSHAGKFHSGEFQSDEAWKVQFNDEGSFYFHDHLNPRISILVVVYSPGKDYKIQ